MQTGTGNRNVGEPKRRPISQVASGYYARETAAALAAGAAGWATLHRDYWEMMSRGAADVALGWLWREAGYALMDCHPEPHQRWEAAGSLESKVESCLFFALCSHDVRVRGTERAAARDGPPRF